MPDTSVSWSLLYISKYPWAQEQTNIDLNTYFKDWTFGLQSYTTLGRSGKPHHTYLCVGMYMFTLSDGKWSIREETLKLNLNIVFILNQILPTLFYCYGILGSMY